MAKLLRSTLIIAIFVVAIGAIYGIADYQPVIRYHRGTL